MDTRKHVRATTALRSTPVALAVALLAGCGDSDLPEHHRELLAQAAAEQRQGASAMVEPDRGEANPDGPATTAPEGEPEGEPEAETETETEVDETTSPEEGDSAAVVPIAPASERPEQGPPEEEQSAPAQSEPTQPEQEQPAPTQPEQEQPEPTQPEQEQPAPAQPEREQPAPAQSEPAQPESEQSEPAPSESEQPAPEPSPAPSEQAAGSDPNLDGAPVEAIDLDDYRLVFADEFDGTALDPAKWKTAFEYGQVTVENELQYYVDTLGGETGFGHDPFTVADGVLTIRAIETPESMRADADDQPWLSGVLSTAGRFEFTRGYAEIRADLPEGAGLGSMLSLIASDYTAPPRPVVTVLRHDGGDADELQHEYRYTDVDGTRLSPGAWTVDDDTLPEGMHTIGVSWDEDGLLFFVDGRATYRIVGDNLPAQPLYLVANLAIGGATRSQPDAATPRPADLVIDRVRVWQRKP